MTRDQAQKRAVRARTAKAGERYTDARHYHLDHRLHTVTAESATVESEPEPVELPPRVAEPGLSEDAVLGATGKTWDEWFVLLDRWCANERAHPAIAQYLNEDHGLVGWWAQGVAVGYERARGMRAFYEHADGFTVSVSKTMAVPVERLFGAFVAEAARDAWLEPGTLRVRTALPHRSARFDVLSDGTRLEAYFTSKGEAKATVAVQHARLTTAHAVETWRAFWKERLDRLAAHLTDQTRAAR